MGKESPSIFVVLPKGNLRLQALHHQADCHNPRQTGRQDLVPIAQLTVEIEIHHAQSLKDRRRVVRSVKDRVRHGFNASIAELDEGVAWNRATLGVVAISSSHSYLAGQMEELEKAVRKFCVALGAEVVDSFVEFYGV